MLPRHIYNCLLDGARRQSSPASSGGVPDFGTPSRSQSFMDLLSPMGTPLPGSSPLLTPGGRALGRGLDESPCISGFWHPSCLAITNNLHFHINIDLYQLPAPASDLPCILSKIAIAVASRLLLHLCGHNFGRVRRYQSLCGW